MYLAADNVNVSIMNIFICIYINTHVEISFKLNK